MGFCLSKSWKPLICSRKKPPEHDAKSTYKATQVNASSSSSAKLPFLSHSLPQKILPNLYHPAFISLDLAAIFIESKAVSLASNPNLEDQVSVFLCPAVTECPSYIPRHQVLFPSPSVTHRATVEVF
jgi:hypothetical protein